MHYELQRTINSQQNPEQHLSPHLKLRRLQGGLMAANKGCLGTNTGADHLSSNTSPVNSPSLQ